MFTVNKDYHSFVKLVKCLSLCHRILCFPVNKDSKVEIDRVSKAGRLHAQYGSEVNKLEVYPTFN